MSEIGDLATSPAPSNPSSSCSSGLHLTLTIDGDDPVFYFILYDERVIVKETDSCAKAMINESAVSCAVRMHPAPPAPLRPSPRFPIRSTSVLTFFFFLHGTTKPESEPTPQAVSCADRRESRLDCLASVMFCRGHLAPP